MKRTKNNTLRFGVIGFGKIARTRFIPSLIRCPFLSLTAIGTRSPEKIKIQDIPADLSPKILHYDELIKAGRNLVDAVYIALPNDMHVEWILKCANAGLHILCEKPLSAKYEDAVICRKRCKESGVLLAEGFMYRHEHRHKRIKEIIKIGEIGRVHLLEASFSYFLEDLSNIRLNFERQGGALMDIGCYGIDLARFLFDNEPIKVFASCIRGKRSKVDELVSLSLFFPKGLMAVITASTHLARFHYYRVRGTDGWITVPNAFIPKDREETKLIIEKTNGEVKIEKFPPFAPFEAEIRNFARAALLNPPSLIPPLEDGVANSKVIDTALCLIGEGIEADFMKEE